jgi:hypothetical protein
MTFLVEECFTFAPLLMNPYAALPSQMASQVHAYIVGTGLAPVLVPSAPLLAVLAPLRVPSYAIRDQASAMGIGQQT